MYKQKARRILEFIDDIIGKGNLLQRATSSAICLDKSLILASEHLPVVDVQMLMQVVEAINAKRDGSLGPPPQPPALPARSET